MCQRNLLSYLNVFFYKIVVIMLLHLLKTYFQIVLQVYVTIILMIANIQLSMKALDLTQMSLTCMSSLRLTFVCIRVKITIALVSPSSTLCYYDNFFLFSPNMNLVTWYDKMKIMEINHCFPNYS